MGSTNLNNMLKKLDSILFVHNAVMRIKPAFTLVEMMFAVVIIGILSASLYPKLQGALAKAKSVECMDTRANMERAEYVYMLENDKVIVDFPTLVSKKYIDKAPRCVAGGVYVWASTEPLKLGCSIHNVSGAVGSVVSSSIAFSSDFNNMDNLQIISGNWSIKNGSLTNKSKDSKGNVVMVSTGPFQNSSIRLTATLNSDSSGYGILYRSSLNASNQISGYSFQLDPGADNKFVLYKFVNGKPTAIASTAIPKGFSTYNAAHDIQVNVVGSVSTISVDGKQIMKITDTTFTSGATGIRNWQGTTNFDSMQITKL